MGMEILAQSTDTCVGVSVSGNLAVADYELLTERMDAAIEANGTVNLVMLIEDFKGIAELGVIKRDFQFGTDEYKSVRRAAFVSDKKWHQHAVQLLDFFTRRVDEKYFDVSDLEAAWAWADGAE